MILQEFMARLSESVELSVASLQRFLTARKGDVDGAFEQMRAVAFWRRENDLDLILHTPYIEKECVDYAIGGAVHGRDKLGRPLYIERTGMMNNTALMELIGKPGAVTALHHFTSCNNLTY